MQREKAHHNETRRVRSWGGLRGAPARERNGNTEGRADQNNKEKMGRNKEDTKERRKVRRKNEER